MSNLSSFSIQTNVPIAQLTTYKTQGILNSVVYPANVDECISVMNFCKYHCIDYFVIGNGSNLLISPNTRKICINLQRMPKNIKIKGNSVYISAQTALSQLFITCRNHGLGGIEKVCTIPASVGGTIKNNASFMGENLIDKLEWIKMIIDGKIKTIKADKIEYSYRHTNLPKGIILSAKLKLNFSSLDEINSNFKDAIAHRQKVQAQGFSCGCVFKNPPNISAGKLIDSCGLAGKQKGDALISPKHCNFIVNNHNATFNDIKYLIEYCKEEVNRKFGILLEEEVEIIQ